VFKEAGFLTDDRPLKVCPHAWLPYHPSSSHKQPLLCFSPFFPFGHDVYCSCIAHFSTRHTVAHRPVNAAALVVPQGYRSLSRRSRRHQRMARMTLEYGPWTSCRSARWEAGHRTGRTCESPVVIFDQARDVPVQGMRKGTRSLAWTIHRHGTIQNLPYSSLSQLG
jgi:hypothetical protein